MGVYIVVIDYDRYRFERWNLEKLKIFSNTVMFEAGEDCNKCIYNVSYMGMHMIIW